MFRTDLALSFLFVTAAHAAQINGAGATFPYPLYSKWFSEYAKVEQGTQINYQSIGSGGGIRQLTDRTIDFGASDAPMNDEQIAKLTSPAIHVPTVLGAVVVTYNLPGVTTPLKLSGETIVDLFLGRIKKWNDPKLAALNAGVALPATDVMVVQRSDGSGTTAVFTDYLAKVSTDWKTQVGTGTSVKWPVGLGGKGNEGVTGLIKQTPGTIGYVELTYAKTNQLPYASIRNAAGTFVVPSPQSVTAAAEAAAASIPDDFRVSITNAAGKGSYPISSFTYLLVYRTDMPAEKAETFKKFLLWALGAGQKFAEPLDYAPLPAKVATRVLKSVQTIKGKATQ
jgi:phosphate transport system substrate-binding protein